jgi:formate dehydrogenase iron-sulfur subunit
MGFFTDTSVCIGCKACEVACKEWNSVPEDGFNLLGLSYDNTGGLGADTWRHVAFIEQTAPAVLPDGDDGVRWLMSSDVCKHCTEAGCLDVCPTGALFRTEFGTVVVQDDVCNGCGYCVAACPFGVIERRRGDEGHEQTGQSHGISIKGSGGAGDTSKGSHQNPPSHAASNGEVKNVGIAQKCTLCYDRLGAGQTPACAQACPTQSIQFGDLDELRERAQARVETLQAAGVTDARLYGENPDDGIGGAGAMFLLLDEPEVYGLPPDPVVTTRDLPHMWRRAGLAAATLLAGAVAVFVGGAS